MSPTAFEQSHSNGALHLLFEPWHTGLHTGAVHPPPCQPYAHAPHALPMEWPPHAHVDRCPAHVDPGVTHFVGHVLVFFHAAVFDAIHASTPALSTADAPGSCVTSWSREPVVHDSGIGAALMVAGHAGVVHVVGLPP